MISIFILLSCHLTFNISWLEVNHKSNNATAEDMAISWPPTTPLLIRNKQTGFYNLTLRYTVEQQFIGEVLPSYESVYAQLISILKREVIKNEGEISELEKLVKIDQLVNMDKRTPHFYLFPQHLDISRLLNAVKSGKPVEEAPVNNPELLVIRTPKTTCPILTNAHQMVDLVVLVKSAITQFPERQHARKSYMQKKYWNGFNIQFAFVVGLPSTHNSTKFKFQSYRAEHQSGKVDNVSGMKSLLFTESDAYGDLLIGNFEDTYFNLTLKLMFTIKWASVFCQKQTKLFLFLDSDFAIIPKNLISLVKSIPDHVKEYTVWGTCCPDRLARRPTKTGSNRWTITAAEYPWLIYPPYSSGAAYMLGSQMVLDAAIVVSFTKYIRIDDAFLGIVFQKLRRQIFKVKDFTTRKIISNTTAVARSSLINDHFTLK